MGKKHIVLVTGGQRSGKSGYAQKLALSLTANPVYLATSRVWDEEFRERVLRHQADRGPEWTNIEEEKYLSRHDLNGRVVVIDCVTLWGTNFFFDNEGDTNRSLVELKEEFNKLNDNLKEIAKLRLENPDMSLTDLGKILKEPIGKSGVNYRLKKIIELAK